MKIAVGMSGGVDSCATAFLLKKAGHDVVGVTMKMGCDGDDRLRGAACSSAESEKRNIEAARGIADKLGIPHHVVDVSAIWRKCVIERFVADYRAGLTPNPCVVCNSTVKFDAFLKAARDVVNFDCFATGHYARIVRDNDGICHLLKGTDPLKDQSYFLARLNQTQLAQTVFPLGEMLKKDVVEIARAAGFDETASRKESQDFAGEEGYDSFFDDADNEPGPIVDTSGRVLGTHRGVVHYTVGQRKNIGIATGDKVYVKSIDAATRTVVLGRRDEVLSDSCVLRDPVWISGNEPVGQIRCDIHLRYRHHGVPALLKCVDGVWRAHFDEPQFAVAPGQAAVAYVGDEVIGSGWIMVDRQDMPANAERK